MNLRLTRGIASQRRAGERSSSPQAECRLQVLEASRRPTSRYDATSTGVVTMGVSVDSSARPCGVPCVGPGGAPRRLRTARRSLPRYSILNSPSHADGTRWQICVLRAGRWSFSRSPFFREILARRFGDARLEPCTGIHSCVVRVDPVPEPQAVGPQLVFSVDGAARNPSS
jgi:hypothetical protein